MPVDSGLRIAIGITDYLMNSRTYTERPLFANYQEAAAFTQYLQRSLTFSAGETIPPEPPIMFDYREFLQLKGDIDYAETNRYHDGVGAKFEAYARKLIADANYFHANDPRRREGKLEKAAYYYAKAATAKKFMPNPTELLSFIVEEN